MAPPPSAGPTAQQGVFIDAAVQGLGFTSGTFTGRTDANGRFDYRTGETVTFTLGRTTLGRVPGGDVITPLTLAATSDETNERVVNITRLLQSLDADGNPENGIVLDDAVQNAADLFGPISFDQSTAAFAADPNVLALLRQARGATATLITTERALGHLRDATFRYRYPGIWRMTIPNGSGEFAIDNEGRVRGSAVYQDATYALIGYVAGNGGIAIYASDPTLPLVQQYPSAIATVARFEGKLIDAGSASGTSLILQPNNSSVAGTWTATRITPTFDLGIRADLAAIIDRFHRTVPTTMRYELLNELRRGGTGELLSDWYLARANACNQERIARGLPPTPLPSAQALRVIDAERSRGVYRQGRGVLRVSFHEVLFDVPVECAITFTPFEAQFWRSDPDDTVYSLPVGQPPRPLATVASVFYPYLIPPDAAIAGGDFSGQTGEFGGAPCLWTTLADGMPDGSAVRQGRDCFPLFDGLLIAYVPFLSLGRSERSGFYIPTLPDNPGSIARTTLSVSFSLNQSVTDDEVTPPVLRARP